MQKIMVIMLFWLLMPFYSWAISLEEIQSHPERYVKETLIQSQNSISHVFSYNASSYSSLNSSLFASEYSLHRMKIQE